MILTVKTEPMDASALTAIAERFRIPVPKFLMKGVLLLKPVLEKAAVVTGRTLLKSKGIDATLQSFELLTVPGGNAVNGSVVDIRDISDAQFREIILPKLQTLLSEQMPAEEPIQAIKKLLEEKQDEVCRKANEILAAKKMPVKITGITMS